MHAMQPNNISVLICTRLLTLPIVKVKVKVKVGTASLWANPITVALSSCTRSQGITQFYLPLTRLSTNEINQPKLGLIY